MGCHHRHNRVDSVPALVLGKLDIAVSILPRYGIPHRPCQHRVAIMDDLSVEHAAPEMQRRLRDVADRLRHLNDEISVILHSSCKLSRPPRVNTDFSHLPPFRLDLTMYPVSHEVQVDESAGYRRHVALLNPKIIVDLINPAALRKAIRRHKAMMQHRVAPAVKRKLKSDAAKVRRG